MKNRLFVLPIILVAFFSNAKGGQSTTNPCLASGTISFASTPKEGSTNVSGSYAFQASQGAVSGTITVTTGSIVSQQPINSSIDNVKKTFQATLTNPLRPSDTVRVVFADAKTGDTIGSACTPVASLNFEWGRARAYFTAGALWVRTNGTFSVTKPFLALDVDYNWYNSQTQNPWLVNTYFEGQLTEISFPQIQQASSSAVATASAKKTSSGASLRPHDATTSTNASSSDFLSAQSSGAVEAGFYAPRYWQRTTWTFNGQNQAIFLAPLAKIGFSAASSGDGSGSQPTGNGDVFRYYGGGLRIGHLLLSSDAQNVAPEAASFIDVTFGQWDNFRVPSMASSQTYRRPLRFDSTGRINIPATPLYAGFEVNVGSGPDDFRVFFGTKIDVGKLLAKLIPSQGN